MLIEPQSARHVSLDRVCRPTLCFPPLGPPGEFPSFNSTIKRYDFLPSIPPHFVSFAWRYLGCTRGYAPQRTSAPSRPGVGNPVSPSGNCRGDDRISQSSWGTIVRLHMFQSDAGRTARTRPLRCNSVAPGTTKARAPTKGLSTLNSMAFRLAVYASPSSLPHPTQDSLPVAGQALLDGLFTRKVPMKGFKVVIYILFPFPKLCLAQRNCPPPETDRSFDASDARSL